MSDEQTKSPPLPFLHPEITFFAQTNFRGTPRRFGIKTDDRRRHMYLLGKTGVGKSTLQEQMILSDIYNGYGTALVDPHGDFAEKILDFIPKNRVNDVVYLNPADVDFPIGFNVIESINPRYKHLVASGLMGVFKKIWPDVWSPRMEYILNNCILALLDYPGSTLLGINRLLVDKEYRKRVLAQVQNPVVKTFWQDEFARYSEKFATEAIAPIQNKVGQFLSSSIIRNITAQVKSTINFREIMDEKKIFIINLSKGRIGEENMRLLGGMIITKLQLAAMERVDILETERKDFYLYVDEFQNFATESFANILSEARKYRLNLIMAHQYIKQLEEEVASGVFGNVGTIVCFRIGAEDAEFMAKEFEPEFTIEDLVNLSKFNMYIKLMIDGATSAPFSAQTFVPDFPRTGNVNKVIRVSRERYGVAKELIEEKIMRWSGLIGGEDEPGIVVTTAIGEKTSAPIREERREEKKFKEEKRFPAVCSRCHKDTDAPFKPDGVRPIYCVDCYKIVMAEKAKSIVSPAKKIEKEQPNSIQRPKGAVENFKEPPTAISLSEAIKIDSQIKKNKPDKISQNSVAPADDKKVRPGEVITFDN